MKMTPTQRARLVAAIREAEARGRLQRIRRRRRTPAVKAVKEAEAILEQFIRDGSNRQFIIAAISAALEEKHV